MKKILSLLILALLQATAWAQFRVEVAGVGVTQIPVAIAAFRGEDSSSQKISALVQADLERSGQFRGVDASGSNLDDSSRPDFSAWRQKNADALLTGSVTRLADGRFDVRMHLWDTVRGQDLGAQSKAVFQADLRIAAHEIADYVYEKLTGDKGIFSTRIAYVTKKGNGFNLWVADADGESPQSALASSEPIISPAWSPNGRQLAYVSYEARKPTIYVHEVATGKRRLVANFKGNNSAPAWSPDGKTLALALSRDGGTQLNLLDVSTAGSEPRRIAQSASIDTEPVFTADGRSIYFVSDRGGSPQIYRVSVSGGSPERVTFSGNYNTSPALSPDGRWLAYVSRVGGAFKLYVMDLASGTANGITDTVADERPSFSPNSRMLIYATQQQGKEALMTSTIDGKVKARLAGQTGDIREPNWGPFQR
ncbi:Tol-Pal system beta propeller repeat protein TolB [Rhodoferax lacus]|nr:Tol-Pal system beta propeller repeat protein TolB [Rhodoferax lacus]